MDINENETAKKAYWFAEKLSGFFGDRVDNVVIERIEHVDNFPLFQKFVIKFIAYNYYPICCRFQMGNIVCLIDYAKHGVEIKKTQKNWNEMNFNLFFEELKMEIELRIPTKYLKAKGWK